MPNIKDWLAQGYAEVQAEDAAQQKAYDERGVASHLLSSGLESGAQAIGGVLDIPGMRQWAAESRQRRGASAAGPAMSFTDDIIQSIPSVGLSIAGARLGARMSPTMALPMAGAAGYFPSSADTYANQGFLETAKESAIESIGTALGGRLGPEALGLQRGAVAAPAFGARRALPFLTHPLAEAAEEAGIEAAHGISDNDDGDAVLDRALRSGLVGGIFGSAGALGAVSDNNAALQSHFDMKLAVAQAAAEQQDAQIAAQQQAVVQQQAAEQEAIRQQYINDSVATTYAPWPAPQYDNVQQAPVAVDPAEAQALYEQQRAEQQRQLQMNAIADEAVQLQQAQQLREQNAPQMAALGYPVQPQRDMLAERQAREAMALQERQRATAESTATRQQMLEEEEGTAVPPAPQSASQRNRYAFQQDPEGGRKVQFLRRSGLEMRQITQLIDQGRIDRRVGELGWTGAKREVSTEAQQRYRDDDRQRQKLARYRAELSRLVRQGRMRPQEATERLRQMAMKAKQAPLYEPTESAAPESVPTAAHAEAEEADVAQRSAMAAYSSTPESQESAPDERGPVLQQDDEARVSAQPYAPEAGSDNGAASVDTDAGADRGGLSAPKLAVAATPTPLPEHRALKPVAAAMDKSRRPPLPPPPFRDTEQSELDTSTIGPYKGNKKTGLAAIVDAVRGAFGKYAEKVTTLYDAFGGSGGYGLAMAMQSFPNLRRLVVGEITPGRLAKIKFLHQNGARLRERAEATGMLDSVRKLWEELRSRGTSSGGALQGRADDEVIEEYFQPDQKGGEFVEANGLDLDEAKGIVYAYVDGLERKSVGSFEELLTKSEQAAFFMRRAYKEFTEENGGEVEYRLGDSFAADYEAGPESVVVVDPPYVGTTGYGRNKGAVGGADLYKQTASLLERLKKQQNGIVYTDEAWWAKAGKDGVAKVTETEGRTLQRYLDRAQAATDYWTFYKVGNRVESVAVVNGFEKGPTGRRTVPNVETPVYKAPETGSTETESTLSAPSLGTTQRGEPLKATPAETETERRLQAQAEANLLEQRKRGELRRSRGEDTELQAQANYDRKVRAEMARLEAALPDDEKAKLAGERTVAEKAKKQPANAKERRELLKAALAERNLPGEIADHQLGVAVNLKNGNRVVFLDEAVPEEEWDIDAWADSMRKLPDGQKKIRNALTTALGPVRANTILNGLRANRTTKLSLVMKTNKDRLAVMRIHPPIAGVLMTDTRGTGLDADYAVQVGKVVDKLIAGESDEALDEEIAQVVWRLMPKADKQAILSELKQFGADDNIDSGASEEAFAAWSQRRLEGMKPQKENLFVRAFRAVKNLLSRLFGNGDPVPMANKSVADRIFEKVQGNEYLAEKPEASTSQAGSTRMAVEKEPQHVKNDRIMREAHREAAYKSGELKRLTKEDIAAELKAYKADVGDIEAQRERADELMEKLDAAEGEDSGLSPVEHDFLLSMVTHEMKTVARTGTPEAFERLHEAQHRVAIASSSAGHSLQRYQYKRFAESADGRTEFMNVHINQLRGKDRKAYEAAKKSLHLARQRGSATAIASAKARLKTLRAKAQEKHDVLRERVKKKFGVDIDSANLGKIFTTRYAVEKALQAIENEKPNSDYTVYDRIRSTFTQGILSFPGTWAKNILGNFPNGLWQVYAKPALEGLMGQRSAGELHQIWKTSFRVLRDSLNDAWAAYKAGYDLLEEEAVNTRTGIQIDNPHGSHAPALYPGLSYLGTRPAAFLDALFKSWSGRSFVAGEAYKVAKEDNVPEGELDDFVQKVLYEGPANDFTGAWEKGYRKAKVVTFQDSFDEELTEDRIRKMLSTAGGVSRGLFFIMPFVGTPFSILRHGAAKFPPFQVGKMMMRAINALGNVTGESAYKNAEGRIAADKIASDFAELAIGSLIWVGMMGFVDKDDDKTFITGSEEDWRSGEGRMERGRSKVPAFSVKILGEWYSYRNVEPFATAIAPIVDILRGNGAEKLPRAIGSQWLLEQTTDAVTAFSELNNREIYNSDNWRSTDPNVAARISRSTRNLRKLFVNTVAGIAVPNLARASMEIAREAHYGKDMPRVSNAPREGQSAFGLIKTNIVQAVTGGIGAPRRLGLDPVWNGAPPMTDLYGRDISTSVSTTSDIIGKIIGIEHKPHDPIAWDNMLINWNQKVHDEGIRDANGRPATYAPSMWEHEFKVGRTKGSMTPEQYRSFAQLAGQEFNRRLERINNNGGFNIDQPTERDIKRYKAVKTATAAWARAQFVRELRRGGQ